MRKTFNFGKIAYYSNRRENLVTVDVELSEKDGKKVFTASGCIWNRIKSGCLSGGQNLDEIAKTTAGQNETFKEIYRLWKLYHLNDMHPECEHQAALGWRKKAAERVEVEKYGRKTTELLGWLRPNEHPDGILTKECPVCGYKYGTAWKYFEIPENDLTKIYELLSEK